MDVAAFFSTVDDLLAECRRPDALDHIFNTIEDALLAGDVEGPREVLREAVRRGTALPLSVFYSLLVVTRPWGAQLVAERRRLADVVGTDEARRMF